MWIKLKTENDQDVFVNFPFNIEDGQGCNLFFNSRDLPLKVKTTLSQMDMLLDANSIEKYKIFDEIYGARAKKCTESEDSE